MHFQVAVLSTLATLATSFAIARRSEMIEAVEHGNLFDIFRHPDCSHVNNVTMNPGSLPPPSAGLRLYHIAIGRGTQVSYLLPFITDEVD